jgi:hypothetical protein
MPRQLAAADVELPHLASRGTVVTALRVVLHTPTLARRPVCSKSRERGYLRDVQGAANTSATFNATGTRIAEGQAFDGRLA